jgi:PAS domain S-box-containing protein
VSGDNSDKLKLLDSNVLFEKLFEFSPDAVLVTDREGTILRANRQTETMLGHVRAELIGRPAELLLPERFRSAAPAAQPKRLGLKRTTLNSKIKKLGIERRDYI